MAYFAWCSCFCITVIIYHFPLFYHLARHFVLKSIFLFFSFPLLFYCPYSLYFVIAFFLPVVSRSSSPFLVSASLFSLCFLLFFYPRSTTLQPSRVDDSDIKAIAACSLHYINLYVCYCSCVWNTHRWEEGASQLATDTEIHFRLASKWILGKFKFLSSSSASEMKAKAWEKTELE